MKGLTKGAHDAEHRPVSPSATRGAREGLSGVPRRGGDGQMATAERIHGQGSPHGRQGRRHVQDVVHEFHYRPQSFFRRQNNVELVREERIRYNDKFDDPYLSGEMQMSIAVERVI